MMMSEIIKKIKTEASENWYGYFGLRIDDREFEIGSELLNSREWDDGELTGKRLKGASVINIIELDNVDNLNEQYINTALTIAKQYSGKNIYLVAGELVEYGIDENEVVLTDCVVLLKL